MTQTDIEIRIMEELNESNPLRKQGQEMLNRTCTKFGISKSLLKSKYRGRYLVQYRKVLGYYLCRKIGLSTPTVGKILGRDHSTIIFYIQEMDKYIENNSLSFDEKQIYEYLNRISYEQHN